MRNNVVLPGGGTTSGYDTRVGSSSSHTLSLVNMAPLSQILQHTKGECRSRRCMIELSFGNQQTFKEFLEQQQQ